MVPTVTRRPRMQPTTHDCRLARDPVEDLHCDSLPRRRLQRHAVALSMDPVAALPFEGVGSPASREEGFWAWIDSQARDAGALDTLDRDKVAELDQRGRRDKQALLQ